VEYGLLGRGAFDVKVNKRNKEAERLSATYRRLAQQSALRAAYHAALGRKYERAARYPWLAIEPDPPIPPVQNP
jgi:hypothetical protein